MTDRELMQEVLEALQAVREAPASKDEIQRAWIVSDLLRRRLAQPEDEPVAWRYRGNLHEFDPSDWAEGPVTPLYTRPQPAAWVALTDEEQRNFAQAMDAEPLAGGWSELVKFARAIEAKLKEKNAP